MNSTTGETTMDTIATQTLKDRVNGRLVNISKQIREIDPIEHSALLVSIMGAMKAQANFTPVEMETVIGAIEVVIGDFKDHPFVGHKAS
jgi:hypothetical protein